MSRDQDRRTFLAFKANPIPEEPIMDRTVPMHPDLPHLRALSYYLIAGFQPRGRTELWRPAGPSPLQRVSDIIVQALEAAKAKQPQPANA